MQQLLLENLQNGDHLWKISYNVKYIWQKEIQLVHDEYGTSSTTPNKVTHPNSIQGKVLKSSNLEQKRIRAGRGEWTDAKNI